MERKAHIIPHSHWDREWRYPIWENRSLLVDFMDELLETLEKKPRYRQFIMDGQSVVLEDYLEIRPEKRELVEKYVKEGRITAGPWYTLPDLYPLDGECLVRNLLKGFRVSEKLGGTMKIAYTSFGWGQTAQLPQIYAGFGIDFCITAKRVTPQRAPKSEFWWKAPDGSRILTSRLGEGGRAQFFVTTIVPSRYNMPNDDNWKIEWKNTGLIYHKADAENANTDYIKFSDERNFYTKNLKENLDLCWESTDDSLSESDRLMLCGCDFSGAVSDLDKVIAAGNKIVDFKLEHSTIEEYIKKLRSTMDKSDLITIEGELREGPSAACSGNALATRIYIKQLNKKVQNHLIHKAEPLDATMMMFGEESEIGFLNKAWDFLLKSHPHDSINGVTQDRTAEDVMYRLNQAYQIADVVNCRCMMKLIRCADLSAYKNDDILLIAYNPLVIPRSEIIKICVDVPKELNAWDIKIVDDEGNDVEWQKIAIDECVAGVHDANSRPAPLRIDRHTIYMNTGIIPAGGFRIYKVEANRTFERNFVCGPTFQRVATGNEISVSDNTLENKYLKVCVNPNGTLKIISKKSGKVYDNMHYFEDTGEVGDYWINIRPNNNRKYNTIGLPAKIWIENNGCLSATLGIETKIELPEEGIRPGDFFAAGSKRSGKNKTMIITSYITLKKNSKKLDVRVEIDNNICDHRVRAVYPTSIMADYSYAHGHFNVDKRPIVKMTDGEYEPDMQTLPMQTFVDITDNKTGVAFINNSLTEFEAKEDGTVYLTMFRSVRNNICTERRVTSYYTEQHGGQCLGMRICEYSIYPHDENWEKADVMTEAERFNILPTVMQISGGSNGNIKPNTSLVSIENDKLVLSTFKKAEDRNSVIMRIYNPTEKEVISKINLIKTPKKVYLVNMNEERINEIDISNSISFEKHKIVTFEFEF